VINSGGRLGAVGAYSRSKNFIGISAGRIWINGNSGRSFEKLNGHIQQLEFGFAFEEFAMEAQSG
jgi:hypothetical protein